VAADQLALSYGCSFNTSVVVLRPFNTYGPRQSARAVLPTILCQLIDGAREVELGRVDTRRDLTFVDDTVDAFCRAAVADGVEGEVIQLGTGRVVSMTELFEAACRATGASATVKHDPKRMRPDASEVLVLQADATQARERLGWTPATTLEEGLAITARWLRENRRMYARSFHL
jgi:UDP-glucose 4-epimerase